MVTLALFADAAKQSAYGAGWLTLAMLNAGIAQGKNRSGLWWFLLSLPFGPITTFFLVALFDKRLAEPEQLID
jgi:hypothetical protein